MNLLEALMEQTDLTVLFVSHELNDVKALFPHTVLLRNGRLFMQGKTEDLFQESMLSVFFQQKVLLKEAVEMQINSADKQKLDISKFLR